SVQQIPEYPHPQALQDALTELGQLPPLVTSWEVESLKSQLAEVARGDRFLLQGGDCAESFDECRSELIAGKLKILLQMSVVLIHGSRKPVTRVGRFAGQYAKPRSQDFETRDGVTLPTYRGDLVNRVPFTLVDRTPDPRLLLQGYQRAALTLNFIRSLVDGGFADLHHPEYWQLEFMKHSGRSLEFARIVDQISESIRFLEIVGHRSIDQLNRVEFFTSHEGLHLPYEEAQTRHVPRRTGWYNLSTHMPWIGNRTRSPDGGHVEYFRGIANPIGVKIGGEIDPAEIAEMVEILHPRNEPGRLTLIHRFGLHAIETQLPKLIDAVASTGKSVVWCCDPMHGNTETVGQGVKTRDFAKILGELEAAFDVHSRKGTYFGGVHFELTGEDVTECTGGARGLTAQDLGRAYRTHVDPRMNYEQALEMAMLIAEQMRATPT
ncbi:MAG TPA: 3-deoxy-7-phosphoheptulonate synthase class II, partial [Pirellulaceae bacterium]